MHINGEYKDGKKTEATLTMVDLAGSENLNLSKAEGKRRDEAVQINKSLFMLTRVISSQAEANLDAKKVHLNFTVGSMPTNT